MAAWFVLNGLEKHLNRYNSGKKGVEGYDLQTKNTKYGPIVRGKWIRSV